MKKLLSIAAMALMAMALMFTLTGCGGDETDAPPAQDPAKTTTADPAVAGQPSAEEWATMQQCMKDFSAVRDTFTALVSDVQTQAIDVAGAAAAMDPLLMECKAVYDAADGLTLAEEAINPTWDIFVQSVETFGGALVKFQELLTSTGTEAEKEAISIENATLIQQSDELLGQFTSYFAIPE